jgi:sulfatase maturation enzyme AslB (radical SAM superfamily)
LAQICEALIRKGADVALSVDGTKEALGGLRNQDGNNSHAQGGQGLVEVTKAVQDF